MLNVNSDVFLNSLSQFTLNVLLSFRWTIVQILEDVLKIFSFSLNSTSVNNRVSVSNETVSSVHRFYAKMNTKIHEEKSIVEEAHQAIPVRRSHRKWAENTTCTRNVQRRGQLLWKKSLKFPSQPLHLIPEYNRFTFPSDVDCWETNMGKSNDSVIPSLTPKRK